MNITGATAVVTGGGSGIGAATAEHLARAGARVVTWDLSGTPDVVCDVSDPVAVSRALSETIEKAGVPAVLVACAGIGVRGSLHDTEVEDWDRVFAVNVRGVFLCLKTVTEAMASAGIKGSAVVISSVNAIQADPGLSAYSASKAAVAQLTRTSAVELGPVGIRVNAVSPGPTATPMIGGAAESTEYVQRVSRTTPLGRLGTADDIAEAVLGILRIDWMTGQVVAVDGGASLATARGEQIRAQANTDSPTKREGN